MVRAKCQYADNKSSASYLYALKFFSSYLLECHVIYFLLKNFKSVLQVEVNWLSCMPRLKSPWYVLWNLQTTCAGHYVFDLHWPKFLFLDFTTRKRNLFSRRDLPYPVVSSYAAENPARNMWNVCFLYWQCLPRVGCSEVVVVRYCSELQFQVASSFWLLY